MMSTAMHAVGEVGERIKGGRSKIDWNDYNWPKVLSLYHFSLDELKEPHLPLVKRMYLLFKLMVG